MTHLTPIDQQRLNRIWKFVNYLCMASVPEQKLAQELSVLIKSGNSREFEYFRAGYNSRGGETLDEFLTRIGILKEA